MNYTQVKLQDKQNIEKLSALASSIVKEHYDSIIGAVQNDYMIAKFQSPQALTEQLEHHYQYYIVENDNGEPIGFLAFYPRGNELYLSKFYLKKEHRRKGLSKQMLDFVMENALQSNLHSITLNVNKRNSAIQAYEKLGFVRIGEEVNDIGNGFVMDDFVYEYKF